MSIDDTPSPACQVTLTTLYKVTRQIQELRWQQKALVTFCREEGATWKEIGAQLGTTAQAAQQRYSKETPQKIDSNQDTLDIDG